MEKFNWSSATEVMYIDSWSNTELDIFKKLLTKTGQVAILFKTTDNDSPYYMSATKGTIISELAKLDYEENKHYVILEVPNINA